MLPAGLYQLPFVDDAVAVLVTLREDLAEALHHNRKL